MKRIGLLFFLLLPLAIGCKSPSSKYGETLQTWVGADINNLIRNGGPPTSTYNLPNGNMVYTWDRSSQGSMAMPMAGGGVIARGFTVSCVTNMTADTSGTIVGWQFRGNACR